MYKTVFCRCQKFFSFWQTLAPRPLLEICPRISRGTFVPLCSPDPVLLTPSKNLSHQHWCHQYFPEFTPTVKLVCWCRKTDVEELDLRTDCWTAAVVALLGHQSPESPAIHANIRQQRRTAHHRIALQAQDRENSSQETLYD